MTSVVTCFYCISPLYNQAKRNMTHPRIPLAREGYPFIAFSAFLTLITAILGYEILAWPTLFLTTFIVAFFRDPERMTAAAADEMISPADGKIILIEEIFDDTYLQRQAIKISIFMNIFNVHVNRIPMDGTVKEIKVAAGDTVQAGDEIAVIE